MRSRFFRALAGAALFLAGYGMQQGSIEPFAGAGDPRFVGLLLEALGLVFLLSPLLGRGRKLPDVKMPRIRRELIHKPEGYDDEPDSAPKPAAEPPDGQPRKDRPDGAD